jgi:tripartite-type tricarboxylate transporter receptor subunit TctC
MKTLFKLLLLLAATVSSTIATAGNKPIHIITPLAVGSAPDRLLREISKPLSIKWGVPVLVDNRPGGGGLVALEYFQRQPTDGRFIYIAGGENVIQSPILYGRTELSNNLKIVSPFASTPLVLFTSTNYKSSEFADQLKKNPTFGSWAIGSTGHVCSIELAAHLNIVAIHVPYKEIGSWLTDTSNGLVHFGFGSIGSTMAFEKSNKIKYIAITSKQRSPWFPNLPTVKEQFGLDSEIYQGWLAFFVSKSVSDEKRSQLENDIREIMADQELKAAFDSMYFNQYTISNKEFVKVYDSDRRVFLKFIKKYNIDIK